MEEQVKAIDKITYDMVIKLGYGETIILTNHYSLYRYDENNTGTVYLVNIKTGEEELAVQIDSSNKELVYTEL